MGWGEPQTPSIEARVARLEVDSHPPMPYLVCGDCHCLVHEDSWEAHARWHRRTAPVLLAGDGA